MAKGNENTVDDSVLEKIRKLLRMASPSGGASENEIEQAMRHARRLMNEYNLSEAEVKQEGADSVNIEDQEAMRRITFDDWEIRLPIVCEHVCDVRAYITHLPHQSVHFVGTPRDCAVAKELYSSLLITVRTMARHKIGKGWTGSHRSYCYGFILSLIEKAKDEKNKSSAAAGAIILSKGTMIKKWMEDNLSLGGGSGFGHGPSDMAAFNMGRADGRMADIGVTNRIHGG